MVRFPSPKRILVTRSAGQASLFTDLLLKAGFEVIEMPALDIRPPSSWAPLDQAIAQLPTYDWLMLTSANAVTYFLDRVEQVGNPANLSTLKVAVVGQKTAHTLKERGLSPQFVPPDFVAESLMAHFPEAVFGRRLLFPRVESGGRATLVKEMTAAGAIVVEVPAYESGCPPAPAPLAIAALAQGTVDIITFASSKTVRYGCDLLQQGLGADWATYLEPVAIASIGPQTSETCQELIGRVDIQPQEYTLPGLTQAIVAWTSALSA